MIKLIVGFIAGFFIATNGIMGVATMIDNAVKFIQTTNIQVQTK
jgi:hypothetical protein